MGSFPSFPWPVSLTISLVSSFPSLSLVPLLFVLPCHPPGSSCGQGHMFGGQARAMDTQRAQWALHCERRASSSHPAAPPERPRRQAGRQLSKAACANSAAQLLTMAYTVLLFHLIVPRNPVRLPHQSLYRREQPKHLGHHILAACRTTAQTLRPPHLSCM